MRIAIIGPGALGCLFAARLSLTDNEQDQILLIDHNPERAKTLSKQGILYESQVIQECCPVPVSAVPASIDQVDILLCCVKAHQLQSTLKFINPQLTPSTLLVFFQNGISHLKYGEQETLPVEVAYATSSEGTTRLADGHIRHAGSGHTVFGFLSSSPHNNKGKLLKLQERFSNGGFACSISDSIRDKLWEKLFVNVGINGLTAIYNRKNGQLLTSCAARGKLKTLVQEAEAVARKIGITIDTPPVKATLNVCKRTATNVSSMLQDVRNRRPTEIDAINGAISRLGKELDVPTPVNDELVSQIRKLEEQYQ